MTIVVGQFKQIAEIVAERLSELLAAPVFVTDDQGKVIASSSQDSNGLSFNLTGQGEKVDYLRVPVRLNSSSGEVIVANPGNREAFSLRLVQGLVDLMINQALVVAGLPNHHELKNKFIHDLLRGPSRDKADLIREGQILGMDLTRPRAVILIDATEYILAQDSYTMMEACEARVRRRAKRVIESVVNFFHLPDETICAYIGDGEVAVLKASTTQDLAAWTDDREDEEGSLNGSWANLTALKRAATALLNRLRHDTKASISLGIGRYHPGIQDLARSYQDARAALSLGRNFHGQNQVHCLDNLGIAAFVGVSDERTKIDLARHLLSPLDQEPELFETLEVFFVENCCPSSTASQLSIHRNTLSYRLDKIHSLSGLDPRRFDEAMQIRLALLLRSLPAA